MSGEQILTATADEIKAKIERLASMADLDLKKAMAELKQMLMDNPTAVQLMEPEDLGELIKSQRRMVGKAAEVSEAKPRKAAAKPKKLSTDEILNMSVDDL